MSSIYPRLYLATVNDALFIIDKPPRPSNDHVADIPGVRVVAKMTENDARADRIARTMVEGYNRITEKRTTMSATTVNFKRLPHGEGLPLPAYATPFASGIDLQAAIANGEPIVIFPHRTPVLVPTGFALEIPAGFDGQVRPRSGLTARTGLTVANSPGTIDCDYRGEILVALINNGSEPVEIERSDRIAQLVIATVARATIEEVEELTPTERGGKGFGSTGR